MDYRGPDWRRRHDEMRQRRARLTVLDGIASPTAEQMFEHGTLLEEDGRYEAALERYRLARDAGHAAAGLGAGRCFSIAAMTPASGSSRRPWRPMPRSPKRAARRLSIFWRTRDGIDAQRYRSRLSREAAAAKMARRERDQLSVVDRFDTCADSQIDRHRWRALFRPSRPCFEPTW